MEEFKFDDGFTFGGSGIVDKLETQVMPENRVALKRRAKHGVIQGLRIKELSGMVPVLEDGFTYHVVSRGNFDSFNFLSLMVARYGVVDDWAFTTWALNMDNVVDMLAFYDDGRVGNIRAFIGTYLKRRETGVYGALLEGLRSRGMGLKAFRNHTKIQMFRMGSVYVVVEGSANLTANGNCENFVITVDKLVWEFYDSWLKEILER